MPTYEYTCDACGKAFELEQRITEKPVKKCLKCGKAKARRLISTSAAPILKGGGWYADLYSSSRSQKKSGDDKKGDDKKVDASSASGVERADKPKGDAVPKSDSSTKPEKKPEKKASSKDD